MFDRSLVPVTQAQTNLVRQTKGKESKRIYAHDATYFATWIAEQGLTIADMTYALFLAYKEHLEQKHQSATASRMLSIARRLLREAVLEGMLSENPGKEVKGISVSNESTHIALKMEEAEKLLRGIKRDTAIGKRDYALVSLLLRTGLRRTECAALTIKDIRVQSGHHVAIIQHGKGDKRRIAKIPVDVFRAIEAYIEATNRKNVSPHASLFCGFLKNGVSTEKGITDKRIEQIVTTYGQRILSMKLTPHDLRASFITLAIEGGASLMQTQYAAGHSDPRTTERYHIRKTNLNNNAVDFIHLDIE